MKIKKLTAYLLMSGMILGTMSSDLYTIKAQAVETIEETEDKTPENETPQIPETPEQPETEPENEEVTEAAPVGEIELSAEQFPDQVILTFAGTCDKDGNGSLSEAECMEVEELAMPYAGITDLKCVVNFRNLQRVDVSQKCDWGFYTGKRSVISADFESKRKSGFRAGCDRMQQSEKAVCSK